MVNKNTTLTFTGTKTIITYDLTKNDVSAATIASQSNKLDPRISISGINYNLPNTTLGSTLETKEKAEAEFRSAFAKTNSEAKIARLFVIEVVGKGGYIKNNE